MVLYKKLGKIPEPHAGSFLAFRIFPTGFCGMKTYGLFFNVPEKTSPFIPVFSGFIRFSHPALQEKTGNCVDNSQRSGMGGETRD
jgi:hypothetical protein